MDEPGQGRSQGLEKFTVLGRVGEVVLPSNDVGNSHGDIVYHVDQVKDRFPVGTDEDKVFFFGSDHLAANGIGKDLGRGPDLFDFRFQVGVVFQVSLPFQPKIDGSILSVSSPGIL